MNTTDSPQSGFEPPGTPAERITRGVRRHLEALNLATLCEFRLPNGRRADIVGLGPDGRIVIIEVKSGAADFRADDKWREYLSFCDDFAFAVDAAFPLGLLPHDVGVLLSDGWDAACVRPWRSETLHPSRRRSLTLRFARTAAMRLASADECDE